MMSKNGFAKPFLKWAGGKRKLMPSIIDAIDEFEELGFRWRLDEGECYHEPFLGSGSVYFALRSSGLVSDSNTSYLSDLNPILINAMNIVKSRNNLKMRNSLNQLRTDYIDEIQKDGFPKDLTSEERSKRFYYRKRSRMNELILELDTGKRLRLDERIELASLMVYLNKTCYNGLWRVNAKGLLNVPEGRYHSPLNIYQPDIIKQCHSLLKGAIINCRTFQESFKCVNPGDLIYIDPPYLPLSVGEYVFTSYFTQGFDLDDHIELARCAVEAVTSGARVIASNNDTEEVREIYKKAAEKANISEPVFVTVPIKRTMSSKGQGRVSVNEVLIFMYDCK